MSELTAIDQVTSFPVKDVNTTCCYCGVGCGVIATIDEGQIVSIRGDKNHPANSGRLCVKGASLHETHHSPDRLLHPLVHGQEASWEQAFDYTVKKFQSTIDLHGADSVAFYLSGQLLTEDYYVANKLMKGFIGTSNIDTNSRLCMASAAAAYNRAFGGDIVPGCYEDLEVADLLMLVGSNMAYTHPVIYQRIVKAKKERPDLKVVVIDPRRTATCDLADFHLPIAPGSDAFFFNGLLFFLNQKNFIDQSFIDLYCEGFENALKAVTDQGADLTTMAGLCDLDINEMHQVYRLFAETDKVVTVFSQGINQSSTGVDKGNAIINCHLATGKIGRKGATPFAITGQPNAMGGREVGGLAHILAAHMNYDSEESVDRVARFWNASNMTAKAGRKAVDMFQDIYDGKIKAIWIMATNPAATMPNAGFVREALQRCDLVMVSDCIGNTDTAMYANVVFPTTTWGEKTGMVTNSERRISLQKGAIPAPGEARHDWHILTEFARRLGFGEAFPYQQSVEIFREHALLSGYENEGGRAFDISALADLSSEEYLNFQPVQWPVNEKYPNGRARLFEDKRFFTKSRKAYFVPVVAHFPQVRPKAEQAIMNTGRVRDQWHTMGRTGSSCKLFGHCDEPFVDINPLDMTKLGLQDGDLVELKNRGARYLGRAQKMIGQRRGEVFAPMHWNSRFSSSSCVDTLVNSFTDPYSGQPEFKHCPVNIKAYDAVWHGLILTSEEFNTGMKTDYWVKIPLPRGLKFRLAETRLPKSFSSWIKEQFPLIQDWAEFNDSDGDYFRCAGLVNGKLKIVFHAKRGKSAIDEHPWLDRKLNEPCNVTTRFALLAGQPGVAFEQKGRVICYCYEIGEKSIRKAILDGCDSTAALGERLKCGTHCGSCLSELNSLVKDELRAKNGITEVDKLI